MAVCAGVILAAVVAVVTASDHGEPVIDVAVTPVRPPDSSGAATRTYLIDAETKESDLPSKARITVIIDGLRVAAGVNAYKPTALFHGKYGPNSDGNLDIHAKIQVTRGDAARDFVAVGIQAAVSFSDQQLQDNPCGKYAKRVSSNTPAQAKTRADLDPGCVVMTLPGPIAADRDAPAPDPSSLHRRRGSAEREE